MKKFDDAFAALQTAQFAALSYLRTEALTELREAFGITVVGQEILVLFRSKHFNGQELFENCQHDTSMPFGMLIPYDANGIGRINVLYFDSLTFDKKTGDLKAPVTMKSFNSVGLNDYTKHLSGLQDMISLFNEILAFKKDFEVVLSDGDDWHPGGQYLTRVSAALRYPKEYEASEHLLEHFFNVNSANSAYFPASVVPYDRDEVSRDNEEYEAVQRELHG